MAANPRKKKLLLAAGSLLAAAALGAGIWFGTRGKGEPVNVYPFEFIGMTEFWGDAQESYGPVTTDKIQTEFLSDTQTVTEVPVKKGDVVKKGDILFSFDTTLDALSLERKRLEVEKVKVQIKAAEERLGYVRQLVPYTPVVPEIPKEDLGDQLEDLFMISDRPIYDGSKQETALICHLKENVAISDAILKKLYDTSMAYREDSSSSQEENNNENENMNQSSASAIPYDWEIVEPDNPPEEPQQEKITQLPLKYVYTGKKEDRETNTVTIGKEPYEVVIEEFVDHKDDNGKGKTYWLTEARRISDNQLLEAGPLTIPGYPQTSEKAQQEWEELWGKGIKLQYKRNVTFNAKYKENDLLISFPKDEYENDYVQLKVAQDAVLVIQAEINNPPRTAHVEYSIDKTDGLFKQSESGGQFFLMGTPESVTTEAVTYTVTAKFSFDDSSWGVEEDYKFSVSVVPEKQEGEFYVVFKTTKDNYLKGTSIIWQGYKVIVYEDGNFELLPYDATGFVDHTLKLENEVEIELPEIRPNEIYTAEQIVDMQKQLYATIKEQTEKLVVVEKEYDVMRRELGDGNIYAEIDGKVMSVLTEEEAREEKQPLVKVSGGGGFYIEGSVSELEKASLKIGQEVTVNDWNSGNTYTGEVVSISDFPAENDNWNGIGNPTASYYPYKAFVGEEADLEAGSHVSMSYSASAAEHGIYLEKAFVRTEKGKSYIYVRGDDGKLEKRTVQVGKVLWGSYYEILSDLSEEDYLAFPYGKDVKQGAPTVESDLSVLYTY